MSLLLCLGGSGIPESAASEADERLRKCLAALVEIGKRQRELPNGSGCRENRKRIAVMSQVDADLKKVLHRNCNPRRISGGEITLAEAEKLVTTWEENGKSMASLLKTERRLQAAICR